MTATAETTSWTGPQIMTAFVALAGLALGIFNFFRARGEPWRNRQAEHRKELRDKLVNGRNSLRQLETSIAQGTLRDRELPAELAELQTWWDLNHAPPVANKDIQSDLGLLGARLALVGATLWNVGNEFLTMERVRDDAAAYADARGALVEYKSAVRGPIDETRDLLNSMIKKLDALDKRG